MYILVLINTYPLIPALKLQELGGGVARGWEFLLNMDNLYVTHVPIKLDWKDRKECLLLLERSRTKILEKSGKIVKIN